MRSGRCRVVPVGLVAAGLVAYGAMRVPAQWYVAAGMTAAALLLVLAGRLGLTARDLGLERERAGSGLRWGGGAALATALALGAGAAVPAIGPLFEDARVAGIGPALLAYRTLVRIPLGTALLEEVAFRGVLFGLWRTRASTGWAAAGSSIVFGLWHVRPALDLLAENDLAAGGPERTLAVLGAVVATTAGGLVLCWLRIRSGSLLAPYLAHTALNSLAIVAAYVW